MAMPRVRVEAEPLPPPQCLKGGGGGRRKEEALPGCFPKLLGVSSSRAVARGGGDVSRGLRGAAPSPV